MPSKQQLIEAVRIQSELVQLGPDLFGALSLTACGKLLSSVMTIRTVVGCRFFFGIRASGG
ncbi:MAG: hypothetical protein PHH36_01970 [Sideroxydans sp.]|nr:hypothetical protein [Sideroxydans sp.]